MFLSVFGLAGWLLWATVGSDRSESLSAEGDESSIDVGPVPPVDGASGLEDAQRDLLTIEGLNSDQRLELNVGGGAAQDGGPLESTDDSISAQGPGATSLDSEGNVVDNEGNIIDSTGDAVAGPAEESSSTTALSVRTDGTIRPTTPPRGSATTRSTARSTIRVPTSSGSGQTSTTRRGATSTTRRGVTTTTRPGVTTATTRPRVTTTRPGVTTATTRRTTTTVRSTTTRATTPSTTAVQPPQSGNFASPNNYRVISGFNPNTNLPSQKAKDAHRDWWAGYNNPNKNWQDSPQELFAPVKPGTSLGTYHYARSGGFYLSSIVDFIRTTGDPAALTELVKWSTQLRSNLKDHDGRGYTYFQYYNPAGENNFAYYDDTNFLDEQMLAGGIANIAWAMHDNRNFSSAAAREADFWFKYLDQNWVPKWLARSTVRQSSPYVPPASLGLQNAVGWSSPDNPRHDDTQSAYDPANPAWNGNGISHMLPVREFGHPYLMSAYQYLVMGKYFQQTGKSVMGTPNRTTNDYVKEANTRHDFWYQKTTPQSDGSREWWLNLSKSRNGLRADAYSQSVNIYLNALHWQGFRNFGRDADMRAYAKVWYAGPNAGTNDVYNQGDTKQMRHFANGTGGNDQFVMMFSSLLGCWDTTGEMMRLNDQAIYSNSSHEIGGGKGFHHGSHYNGILSCELMKRS